MRDCFQPEGAIEEAFVQKIANCLWREARANRHETGMIRQRLIPIERQEANAEEYELDAALQATASRPSSTRLFDSSAGLRQIRGILDLAITDLEHSGRISPEIGRFLDALPDRSRRNLDPIGMLP
jgi:hypothetical protein